MSDQLTPAQLAEAERLGVSSEQYAGALAVAEAEAAQSIGLTLEQFRNLKAASDRAQARGYGVNQEQWAAATGRALNGRRAEPSR